MDNKPRTGKDRKRVYHSILGESKTMQSAKDECDINNIMRQYRRTGMVAHVNRHQGKYEDLTDVPDYYQSMLKIKQANESFSELPAEIRKQFNNDPGHFIDFVSNPDNLPEMQEMGLIPSESQQQPKTPVSQQPTEPQGEVAPEGGSSEA